MNFKNLLKTKKITQIELAKEVDLKQQTVSNWCTGYREPTLETLVKIANYLNVSIDTIVLSLIETKQQRKEWFNIIEFIIVIILIVVYLMSIRMNEVLMYLFEEYVYQKYYLNQEKEDEKYGKNRN